MLLYYCACSFKADRRTSFTKYFCYQPRGIYSFFILLCIISHNGTSRLKLQFSWLQKRLPSFFHYEFPFAPTIDTSTPVWDVDQERLILPFCLKLIFNLIRLLTTLPCGYKLSLKQRKKKPHPSMPLGGHKGK